MNSQPQDFEDLQQEFLKLEKQNHRLKRLGVAALIIPAILLVMAQAPSRKTVEANEFILRDNSGIVRARLSVNEYSVARFELFDGNIQLTKGNESLSLMAEGIAFSDPKSEWAEVAFGKDRLKLVDKEGFSATLGVGNLGNSRTGETRKTSAASLVLFDKNKKVIWEAP